MTLSSSVIFLFGPTATGKTALALYLAEHLPCDIISVDAIQVYRGLSIGSAKPSQDILHNYPHHLVDIREPEDVYSVADFYSDAQALVLASLEAGRIPLFVGGSMMYFAALERGIARLPGADMALRAHIVAMAERYGWAYWHAYLQDVDPVTAAALAPGDSQRLQRAVEVWMQTGQSLRQLQQDAHQPGLQDWLEHKMLGTRLISLGLAVEDRPLHHTRLETRFQAMLASGLVEEVAGLYHRPGLDLSLSALNSVGYRQVWQYLQGSLSYAEVLSQALVANRRLAKHQMTWLRACSGARLFACEGQGLCAAVGDYVSGQLEFKRGN